MRNSEEYDRLSVIEFVDLVDLDSCGIKVTLIKNELDFSNTPQTLYRWTNG